MTAIEVFRSGTGDHRSVIGAEINRGTMNSNLVFLCSSFNFFP
jgi:hypothetical protein